MGVLIVVVLVLVVVVLVLVTGGKQSQLLLQSASSEWSLTKFMLRAERASPPQELDG